MTVDQRATRIRLILFDVDGVLTDGRVVLHGDGSESKQFHIRDGIVMVWAQRVGLKVGLLSARMSATTTERAAQLGITLVHQGVPSKIEAYEEIVGDIGLNDDEVAYMGDDIVDLAVLGARRPGRRAGRRRAGGPRARALDLALGRRVRRRPGAARIDPARPGSLGQPSSAPFVREAQRA